MKSASADRPEDQTVVLRVHEWNRRCDLHNGSTITTRIEDPGQSVLRTLLKFSLLQPKQHSESLAHIGNDVGWSLHLERESPRLPVEVLDVIGEDHP
jgi:hypothetical protein